MDRTGGLSPCHSVDRETPILAREAPGLPPMGRGAPSLPTGSEVRAPNTVSLCKISIEG